MFLLDHCSRLIIIFYSQWFFILHHCPPPYPDWWGVTEVAKPKTKIFISEWTPSLTVCWKKCWAPVIK